MTTPEMAREAFQSAMPARREQFQQIAANCFQDALHQHDPRRAYLASIMREAKKELRHRLEMAAERVRQLINSGWSPQDVRMIETVYREMFSQLRHWNGNPYDDLYAAVRGAFEKVGLAPTPEGRQNWVLEYSQYLVDVSTELTHDLEFHMAAKQPNNQNVTNLNFQGNVNFLQTGGVANVTQHIGIDATEAVQLLRGLKDAVTASDEPFKAAIVELVDRGIDESTKSGAAWSTVASTLNGLQNLIRTAGAVPAAYNLLAGLLAAHGAHLPALPPP